MPQLLMILTSLFLSAALAQQTPGPPKKLAPKKADSVEVAKPQGLTVDGIISLVQAGLSDDLVISRLRKEGTAFDLSAEELIKLKKAGASDRVLTVMMDPKAEIKPVTPALPAPTTGLQQAPNPSSRPLPPSAGGGDVKSVKAVSNEPSDLPQNPGVYYKTEAGPVRLEGVQKIQGRGPGLKSLVPGVPSRLIGVLAGPHATFRVSDRKPVFYLVRNQYEVQAVQQSTYGVDRPPEAQLVKLKVKNNQREIELSRAGGFSASRGGYPPKSLRAIAVKKLSTTVYEIAPVAELESGEYLLSFLFLTAEFDFGIGK
ncbi:MAG: hypothetical protein IT165_28135 [Bryobacterales bacterium]|nr:hypothetical protein [Bryobacterales bacterium]